MISFDCIQSMADSRAKQRQLAHYLRRQKTSETSMHSKTLSVRKPTFSLETSRPLPVRAGPEQITSWRIAPSHRTMHGQSIPVADGLNSRSTAQAFILKHTSVSEDYDEGDLVNWQPD
uniref:Uncharacterized protein n=1 Tax=Schistocephalus solidus TaxID=70667 RepID=A0A0V0JB87_SCHSO